MLRQALEAESSPSKMRLLEQYAGHLRQQLIEAINHPQHREKPLSGLKIVVDAGNGSGGFFASQVCVQGLGPLHVAFGPAEQTTVLSDLCVCWHSRVGSI